MRRGELVLLSISEAIWRAATRSQGLIAKRGLVGGARSANGCNSSCSVER